MKILVLTKKFPYPVKDGETLAINTLSKALAIQGAELTLLAMNTTKHYFDAPSSAAGLKQFHDIIQVKIDNRIKVSAAFFNLFSSKSYHIERFESVQYSNRLAALLQTNDYDIVQLETLYLACYIPIIRKYSKAKIAMRSHNVEQEIWQRIAKNTTNPLKKIYLNYLTNKLSRFEDDQLDQYDILLAITKRDLIFFQQRGFRKTGETVPIGVDCNQYHPDERSYRSDLSVAFIGSMDWMPNLEGLKWFLNHVWCNVHQDILLHIAGRNCPSWLLRLKRENVIVHGEVPDAKAFVNQHSLMIVPILSGSGMRAKILEGMALEKVVLTTSIGLEGIEATHLQEVIIADTAEEFKYWIAYCYENPEELPIIGRRARVLVEKKYNSSQIAAALLQTYEHCIR